MKTDETRPASKKKLLIFYIFYVGIVFAIGAKMGVFSKPTIQPQKVDLNNRPASQLPFKPAETLDTLPQGVLVFDKELQQAVVYEGDKQALFVFNFTNTFYKEVTIKAVNTSCGCTTAELPALPWILPSGAKGRIPITMNVLGQMNQITKTITVTTDQGIKTLYVEANIISSPDRGKMGGQEQKLNTQNE
jgi:hypothetical protein